MILLHQGELEGEGGRGMAGGGGIGLGTEGLFYVFLQLPVVEGKEEIRVGGKRLDLWACAKADYLLDFSLIAERYPIN